MDSSLIHYSTVLDNLEMSENDGSLKADNCAEARAYVRRLKNSAPTRIFHLPETLVYHESNPWILSARCLAAVWIPEDRNLEFCEFYDEIFQLDQFSLRGSKVR